MTSWHLRHIQEVSKSDFVRAFLLALLEKSRLKRGGGEREKSIAQPNPAALEEIEHKL